MRKFSVFSFSTVFFLCSLILIPQSIARYRAHEVTPRTVQGVVARVSDGDTVKVVTSEGTQMTIRLYGCDAPEIPHPGKAGQPYGKQAKEALFRKISGQEVLVHVIDTDRYHRVVAVIELNGRDINAEMVREGWAWAYRQYLDGPYVSEFIEAEEQARKERRGLWQESNPQPPWEFRHTK